MNRKRIFIFVGLLFLAAVILFGVMSYGSRTRPVEPTPTPTIAPTPDPIPFTSLGGPIAFGDRDIVAILAQTSVDASGQTLPPVIPTIIDKSSGAMLNYPNADAPDYTGVDVVWFGSRYYADLFKAMRGSQVHIYGEKTIFTTKLMLYTWWPYLDELVAHGYVVKIDNYFVMPGDKFVELMNASLAGQAWADLGLDMGNLTNKQINFSSSEYGSSTGSEFMSYMANCYKPNDGSFQPCSQPVTPEELPSALPTLIAYVTQQGGQGRSSIPSFGNFITDGQGNPFFVGFDSAFPSWAGVQGWSTDQVSQISTDPQDPSVHNHLVGIYLENAPSSEHVFFALTETGLLVMNKLNNPEIQAIAWHKLGMTTPQVFFYDAPIPWMSTTMEIGNRPSGPVYEGITAGLDAVFKH